ncbi:MAG TPA: hypothetical protein VKF62_08005 [Planctomycetota bacterium]|nr:hypothetical protein [Planctomycetota bacterium]
MGKSIVPMLLPAVLLLASAAPAQGEGSGPLFASLGGLWDATVTTSFFSAGGTLQTKVKTKTFIEFQDEGSTSSPITLRASSFPTGLGLMIFPATAGMRFLDYFVVKGPEAEFAGTLKVDRTTLEARSFRATGTLLTTNGVIVVAVKGRHRPGTTKASLFSQDFESGLAPYVETDVNGTESDTLWHDDGYCAPGTPLPASMGSGAAAYNQGDLGAYDYDTGVANSGALQGPGIPVPTGSRGVTLVFDTLRLSEAGSYYDQTWVDLRPTGEGQWIPFSQTLTIAPCGAPQVVTIGIGKKTLKAFDNSFEHRFRFDTLDGINNDHLGWYIDNVQVLAIGTEQ